MPSAVVPDLIRTLPLFSGLSEQEKSALLTRGSIRQCKRGQMLFHHGEPVTHFYILLSGNIQLFRETPDGHEKTLEILKSGQALCGSEIMDSCRQHRANAAAVSDANVMEFPASWLIESARKHSTFALNMLSLISGQAHKAETEAEHQATMSAPQMVACFMQRLCVIYDFDPKGFELPYSKTLIASRLGMELETFSRTLSKLKDIGIAVTGTHVSINDLKSIEHYVCNSCSVSENCPTHHAMSQKSGMLKQTSTH